MYLDVKVCKHSAGNSLVGRLALVAGEVPSEPGGVGARTIPFETGQARKKWWSVLRWLRRMALCETARRVADGQSVPG
jgi:hypothetical protein